MPSFNHPPPLSLVSSRLKDKVTGLRINAIAPGPTRSEMFDAWITDDESRAGMAVQFPMNYIADPDGMARTALFLLSDESRWAAGCVFPCEGGRSIG